MLLATTLLIGVLAIFFTTALHYETISYLDGRLRKHYESMRRSIPMAVAAMVCAHLVEIGIYALVFAVGAGPLGLGHFVGPRMGITEYFYFAAEAYTSFGYGDIVPTSGLRVIASMTPLNGLLLLAWSGSFLYAAVHQRRLENR
jgi:hypothetical protein